MNNVTVQNLGSISFMEMLDTLSPFLLEEVPEGGAGDPNTLTRIDQLLGRFSNLYAYLIHLWAFAAYEANRLKIAGSPEWSIMVRKKDALYEFAAAIKLKWKACSRMITASEHDDEDMPEHRNYAHREPASQAQAPRPGARPVKGWSSVPS